MLREARESLGLSVGDVATQIKFAPRQIEALEADDFKNLPEAAFVRGFVRSYAKILHLDTATLLAALPQKTEAVSELTPVSVNVPYPVAHSPQKQNLILLGAALFLSVVVVGFAVWHFTTPVKQPKVAKVETPIALPAEMPAVLSSPAPSLAPVTAPVVEPKQNAAPAESKQRAETKQKPVVAQSSVRATKPASVQAVQQADDISSSNAAQITTIRLVFGEESWTEISDKDGKILSSQVHAPGSEFSLKGRMPILLVIGHAASAHLYQDGEQVDLKPFINSSSEVARLTLEE
ncbi:MAG: helix-turn-helix domain-containing protein [Nitrosomonadales bacterium]|nr:helix-turn-helix domain-containing protein [Nitrosomonadales bacterium]